MSHYRGIRQALPESPPYTGANPFGRARYRSYGERTYVGPTHPIRLIINNMLNRPSVALRTIEAVFIGVFKRLHLCGRLALLQPIASDSRGCAFGILPGLLISQADWLGLIWLRRPSLNFVAYSLDSSGLGPPRIAPQSAPQLTHSGFSGRCPNF